MSFLYGAAEGADITVGSTTVTGGATTRVLYDNAGVLGEYTVSGSGSVAMTASPVFTGTPTLPTPFTLGAVSVTATGTQLNYLASATGTTGTTSTNLVFSTSPSLVTPALGVATGTSLALGGATIGTNALAVTGTANISAQLTVPAGGNADATGSIRFGTNAYIYSAGSGQISIGSAGTLNAKLDGDVSIPNFGYYSWSSTSTVGGARDLFIGRRGAANLLIGPADAAAPVAQTLSVQSVVAGTADTAGQPWTFTGSISTGTGAPGDMVFQTAGKGAASTVQNTLITALTIKGGTTNNTNVGQPSIVIGNAALGTTATDGFLYIPTCAGPPTGVPTAFTGRVALVYDSTNHQFYIYDGGWKQPKTPAAAAIVTWQ